MKQNCNHKLIFFFFKNTSFFITNLPKKIKKSIWATTPCYMPNFWRVKMGWTKDTDRFKVFLIYISQFIKYNLFLIIFLYVNLPNYHSLLFYFLSNNHFFSNTICYFGNIILHLYSPASSLPKM